MDLFIYLLYFLGWYTFDKACRKGDLDIVKWILNNKSLNKDSILSGLDQACCHGHLYIAKWIHANSPYTHNLSLNDINFDRVCHSGHMEVVEWLYSISSKQLNSGQLNSGLAFEFACSSGHLDIAKWLYEHKMGQFNNLSIFLATRGGKVNILKWMLEINSNLRDAIWLSASMYMNTEVVIWLYTDKIINVPVKVLFKEACTSGNLDLVQRLYSPGEIDMNDIPTSVKNIRVVDWLCSIFPLEYKIIQNRAVLKEKVETKIISGKCTICWESDIEKIELACEHVMCRECFFRWKLNHETCPFCTKKLVCVTETEVSPAVRAIEKWTEFFYRIVPEV